ncbi:MAG: zinc ribbon domain-containing protein [Candidatus Omnitrophica bacterium]|nr:zinc ribbon domain-containing protein [Candidatus Omnitrophota bacterium]
MPTYDYECLSCGHKFEKFQKMSDEPLKKCPECNKKVKRLIGSGAGIIFKGSGFYATDYKKSTSAQEHKKNTGSCPKSHDGCGSCPHSK